LICIKGITLVGDYEVDEFGDAFIEFLHIKAPVGLTALNLKGLFFCYNY
jgi:hypothetical protein